MNEIPPPKTLTGETRPALSPPEIRPVVIVAPGAGDPRDFVVVREPDDTDADYQARADLFALLLDHIGKN